MTALDLNAVALRKSPTVRFEGPFIGPDRYGWIRALHDGECRAWREDGTCNGGIDFALDLVPLVTKREPLRCWVNPSNPYETVTFYHAGWTPMVEAAELDRVKAAGQALADEMMKIAGERGAYAEPFPEAKVAYGTFAVMTAREAAAAWKEATK